MRVLIPEEKEHSAGEVIGYVIGVLYFFGIIYYLYRLHLLTLFQMFMNYLDDNENEEQYKPILYSCLNSIQFLILCFYSTFVSESDLAISTIIGSDAFMIFFIFSLILYKFPTHSHGILDAWVTIRDVAFYIITLFILFICILLEFLNIGTAIFLLVIYFANVVFIFNSESIKSKMMDWFDLTAEDEDYSCESHLTCVKRRISITQLKDNNFIQQEDPALIRKLALNNKANTQKSGSQKIIFQKSVYIIIFALKNQIKQEKQYRVDFYTNMYKPKQRGPPSKKSKIEPDSSIPDSHHHHHQHMDEEMRLIENNENDMPIENQQNQDQEAQYEDIQHKGEQAGPEQEQEIEQQDGKHKLALPKDNLDKVMFIIFFPARLICHFIPTPKNDQDYVNIIISLLISLMIVAGLWFLIDWWIYQIFDSTGIPIQILGFIFLGVLVQAQLAYHQVDIAKEDLQLKYTQTFFQTAICKSSLCIGITWGIQSLVNINTGLVRRSSKHSKTFALCIIIFCGLVAFLLFQCWLKRFILGKAEAQKYMVLYFLFIILIAIIIPLDVVK